ncbi:hypothetical protein Ahy_B03g063558 [Arachis hypogaea]|uniref:Uncharacterized protein n=1 Tax=Arachis hypogaea TaxID=3818 RepID=A0A444ZXR1_ARAHY|nr:hypothetical protein Ahy_B03g063558 [Arachis hypogaea]
MPPPKGLPKPGGKPNHNKNKEKNPVTASPNPKGLEIQPRVVKGKDNDLELESLELVVKEYMKRMEREKWEAFNSSKSTRMTLDQHVVRDNMLFNSRTNQHSPGERLGIVELRGNQVKQSDVLMIEAGSRDSKEESSSRGLIGPKQGASARKGAGSKAFPSIIRDLRQEYEANFSLLSETHVSGTQGKQVWDKMGFDKSFVVDAMGHSGGIWLAIHLEEREPCGETGQGLSNLEWWKGGGTAQIFGRASVLPGRMSNKTAFGGLGMVPKFTSRNTTGSRV